jgi:hypothetical protein
MPIRRRRTKPGIKVKGPIQTQTVKQSVKVIIQAPPKPVRRRRATGGKKGDMFRDLMRAPEYTTFTDLTPVSPSTGYVSNPPPQPFRNDLNQLRIENQDRVGSVSGGLSIAPQGLLPAPEEKKEDAYIEDVTEKVEKLETEKANRNKGLAQAKETRQMTKKALVFAEESRKKRGLDALKGNDVPLALIFQEEAKKQKADTFRQQRLMKSAFGALKGNVDPLALIFQEETKKQKADTFRQQRLMKSAFGALKGNVDPDPYGDRDYSRPSAPFVPSQPPPPPPPLSLMKKKGLVTTQQALKKMKSISQKYDK